MQENEKVKYHRGRIKDIVRPYFLKNKTIHEIVEITGLPRYSVTDSYKRLMRDYESFMGTNKDRHKCKTCIYRPTSTEKTSGFKCMYILVAGHSRGCSADNCVVYQHGTRKKKNSSAKKVT